MLTNECWMGYHERCDYYSDCECLCHAQASQLVDEATDYLMKE